MRRFHPCTAAGADTALANRLLASPSTPAVDGLDQLADQSTGEATS